MAHARGLPLPGSVLLATLFPQFPWGPFTSSGDGQPSKGGVSNCGEDDRWLKGTLAHIEKQ